MWYLRKVFSVINRFLIPPVILPITAKCASVDKFIEAYIYELASKPYTLIGQKFANLKEPDFSPDC